MSLCMENYNFSNNLNVANSQGKYFLKNNITTKTSLNR